MRRFQFLLDQPALTTKQRFLLPDNRVFPTIVIRYGRDESFSRQCDPVPVRYSFLFGECGVGAIEIFRR